MSQASVGFVFFKKVFLKGLLEMILSFSRFLFGKPKLVENSTRQRQNLFVFEAKERAGRQWFFFLPCWPPPAAADVKTRRRTWR